MSVIKVQNPNTALAPKTTLAVNQNIGVGTLYVKNPTGGFQGNWAVQIGASGEENAEIVLLNSSTPTGTQMVLSGTTLYEHAADTPVFGIKYDKVVFAKSSAGTTGTASPITNGTVSITPGEYDPVNKVFFTQFDDTSGASTDAYRSYYLNSATSGSTSLSDWITPAGYSFYSLNMLRQRVKDKLWSSGYIQDDSIITNWINEWKDELSNAVINVNEDYAMGSTLIGFGADGLGTITDETFTNPRRVWITFDGGNNYSESIKLDVNDVIPNQTFLSSTPRHAFRGNNVLQVFPSQAGSASVLYYKFGTTLVNDTDLLPQPMRSFTKSFVDYGVAQAAFVDGKMDLYDRVMQSALAAKDDFVSKISNRDKSSESYIKQRAPISGEDTWWPI